jgi:hypothetical protein
MRLFGATVAAQIHGYETKIAFEVGVQLPVPSQSALREAVDE